MATVGEKLRRKREQAARLGLDLASVPKRGADGRKPRATTREGRTHTERDPRKTALEARCRQEGRTMTAQDRIAVSGPLSGSQVGLCIRATFPDKDQSAKLWETWCGYTAALATYERRILQKSIHAKGAKIEMEPERIETDTHHTVDVRTDVEKDNDATRRYMAWKGYAWEIGAPGQRLLEEARKEGEDLWQDAAPTRKGVSVAYMIRDLARAREGR